jgi:hypothetical protein
MLVLLGVLAPPALALVGYAAAGRPHVECGETAATGAFYRVAIPFFAAGGLAGALVLVRLSPAGRVVAALTSLLACDALLPGALHHPAGAVVVALGIAAVVGGVVTAPTTVVLGGCAVVVWLRRRHAEPTRGELRLYTALVSWSLAAVLPAVVLLLSLSADPICFTF